MRFSIESFFNPNLPEGGRRMDAVLTVTARTGEGAPASPVGTRVIGLVIDCSGSMFNVPDKIAAAKHAARRCIGLLDPTVMFFIVAFGSDAQLVCPLGAATVEAKARADRVVQNLGHYGGTVMSRALAASRGEFAKAQAAIRYVMFLTDGENEGERAEALQAEIERCKGVFQCDCRGIGIHWNPSELRRISNALLGTADAVPDPNNLEAAFREALASALAKGTGDVRLDLWQPASVKLVALRQMQPDNIDLTALGRKASERITSFPLGAWTTESRDYHAVFSLEPGELGEEMLVARPSAVSGPAEAPVKASGPPVTATWSGDAELTTRISPEVAHYTGQADLADSIREGLDAKKRGDEVEATRLLGRAAQLADASGNAEVTRRLAKVVDVVDATEGTVRLRRDAGRGAELELEMGGTRTVRRSGPR